MLIANANNYCKEWVAPNDARSFVRVQREQWWENNFKEFMSKLNQFVYNLLYQSDLNSGSVSFSDLISLLICIADPFDVLRSNRFDSLQPIDKNFQDAYLKQVSYYFVNLFQHVLLFLNRKAGYIDDCDLHKLDLLLSSRL